MTTHADAPAPMTVAGGSDAGPARQRNEDRFVAARIGPSPRVVATSLPTTEIELPVGSATGWIFAVADGMGGHAHGDRASTLGLTSLLAHLPDPGLAHDAIRDGLREAFHAGAERVRAADPAGYGRPMGTTLTAAFAVGSTLFVLHAGDSRAYRLRGGSLTRLTRDHTMAQRLIDRGAVTEEEMRQSPLTHQLVNSLGGGTDSPEPDLSVQELLPGDRLILCSDGLSGVVTEAEITSIVEAGMSDEGAVEALLERALAREPRDNVTVLVATRPGLP